MGDELKKDVERFMNRKRASIDSFVEENAELTITEMAGEVFMTLLTKQDEQEWLLLQYNGATFDAAVTHLFELAEKAGVDWH